MMARYLLWFLAAFSATSVLGGVYQRGPLPSHDTYFVSAPNTVIPGKDYSVSVDILNGTDVEVTAGLQQEIYNRTSRMSVQTIITRKANTFSKGNPGVLTMMIPEDFKCQRCRLIIQGRGGQVFERSHHITVKSDILSIFIQTDKAIYKPGQRVRYRAFAVYQDLQLHKGSMTIEIREPSGNKMKVESGLSDPSAVVEGFFDLSDQPPFGDWVIKVKVEGMGQAELQTFTVAQYDLPRFEVTVDLPPYVLLQETSISGTVKAKYTYGKPVEGMVDLHVGPDRGPDSCGKLPKTVNIGFEIDGEGKFTIPKSSVQRVMSIGRATRVRFTAIITETATGVKVNGRSTVQYFTKEHSISFLSSTPNVFKPGLPYKAHIQVKKPDGLPPSAGGNTEITVWPYARYVVTVPNQDKYGTPDFSGTYALPKKVIQLPANGIAPIDVDIPSNATKLWFKVYYGKISTSKNIEKPYSPSNNFVQLTLLGQDIKSGNKVEFKVQATEAINKINYQVISRKSITEVNSVDGNGRSTFNFDITVTEDMGPVANLLVYYVRDDGEVVADSISFNVDGIFKNKVALDFSKEMAEPNNNIKLNVKADPLSKVYLLAVDESVLLLKSGNDITPSKVQDGVSDQRQMDSKYALSNSATEIEQVFTKSGLVVITDASLSTPMRQRGRGGHRRKYNSISKRRFGSRGPPGVAYDSEFALESSMTDDLSPANPLKEVKRIRNKFPEAWLWTDVFTNADGSYTINTTVPDTITTWVASAFATNQRSGLGVVTTKANVTVFRSFFVSLTYPPTLKRNEQAVIQATIFNYLPSDLQVTVTLKDSSGFKHIEISGDDERVVDTVRPQRLWVRADSNGVVYFPIVGKDVGVFDIEVLAQSNLAADGVRRQITIEPEGAPNSFSRSIFLHLSGDGQRLQAYNEKHNINFPESTVEGSKKITVGLSGDLIGSSFDNIDDLLSIPTGCGEQNMIRLAPVLYIAKYLKATGQLTHIMAEEVSQKLSSGYQSQLSYRRSDGSFSAFGNNDESGSTWLTAYVSRVLSEAREFTYIDPNILTTAVDWLVERQRADGAFVEMGRVIDPNTQGKKTGPALTAHVLLTLGQNKDLISPKKCEDCENISYDCTRTWKWSNSTINATKYLEKSIEGISDPFSMSVVTYALATDRNRNFYAAFRKLRGMATREGGLTCWKGNSTTLNTTPAITPRDLIWRPPKPQTRPIDTLITAYSLMAFTAKNKVRQALPVVRCLAQQKNFQGGFESTQDTSVGLQALAAFATRSYDPNNKLVVTFTGDGARNPVRFDIDHDNMLNYQTHEFPITNSKKRNHDIVVEAQGLGNGTAVAEISYSYNTLEMPDSDAFDVSTVLLSDTLENFNLMICTKWLKSEKTGMVVQEIEIPSGFEPDLGTIGNVAGMKRYERKGNMAVVYFDEIVKTSTCYSILMSRKSKVAKSEKTFVHTFNYYNPEDTSTVFYHPRQLKTSTICDVCPKCC